MRRLKTASILGIFSLSLLIAPSANAVELNQVKPARPAATNGEAAIPVELTVARSKTSTSADNCTETLGHARLRAAAKLHLVACLGGILSASDVASQIKRKRPAGMEPIPDWCFDHANGNWWYERTEACLLGGQVLKVYNLDTGELVGELDFSILTYSYTSPRLTTWAHQITIAPYDGWGAGLGSSVEGSLTCSGDCVNTRGSFPSQPAALEGKADGEFYTDTTDTVRGSIGSGQTTVSYLFTNPLWVAPVGPGELTAPAVRCDNALPGPTVAGCVFGGYDPVMIYSVSGPYSELADHIFDAQASGLPGAYGSGTFLHRLTDGALSDKNRDTACPSSLPRPPGKSCDEYPFASTWEGAFTGGGAYSQRMIDDTQNSTGGTALNQFYYDNRVTERDPFTVWITS